MTLSRSGPKLLSVLFLTLFISSITGFSQIQKPVKWSYSVTRTCDEEAVLVLKAKIEEKWHLYSQKEVEDGPIPTSFIFTSNSNYSLAGKTQEGTPIKKLEPAFDNKELAFFENKAEFSQKIKITSKGAFTIKGVLNFMVCNDAMCLPPEDVKFEFKIDAAPGKACEGSDQPITNSIVKIEHPIKWNVSVTRTCDEEALLIVKADIQDQWHLYSQNEIKDGPRPTTFTFTLDKNYSLVDKTSESTPIKKREPVLDSIELEYFEKTAEFRQKIKINTKEAFSIKGTVNFTTCNEVMCLPPSDDPLEFKIDAAPGKACENTTASGDGCSFWSNFFKGLAAGFGALIAPCIYAMLPLTVSFFMKQSKTRSQGIRKAALYGFFIVLIFDLFGFLVVLALGRDAPNLIASSILLNLFLFALFFIFAASFLGAFEITLPASWVNKADAASDKGGIVGMFFMALTLTLVSFSCTAPFIGGLLNVISYGNFLCPLAGFTGFGLAIALPFAICAAIPSVLSSMPKSGGWLNAVKVTLGLIELALAMKFFSNADINGHWHILSRELFIAIWIAIFAVLGMYLLGKIKFSHDSDVPYLSVTRTTLAIFSIAFAIYLVPGLWGAPLNLVGAFPPPNTEEWSENFNSFGSGGGNNSTTVSDTGKTSENKGPTHGCPKGINNCFHDYYEALAYAKKVGKPLMVDFTGWTCVNCRKMEQNVWPKSAVRDQINNDFVLVSLYVDERNTLPVDSQYYSKILEKQIVTQGDKWNDLEASRYNNNAQPYYVLLDNDQKLLAEPKGYTPDVDEYAKFLKDAVDKFKANKK